jgi:hypothetical protein
LKGRPFEGAFCERDGISAISSGIWSKMGLIEEQEAMRLSPQVGEKSPSISGENWTRWCKRSVSSHVICSINDNDSLFCEKVCLLSVLPPGNSTYTRSKENQGKMHQMRRIYSAILLQKWAFRNSMIYQSSRACSLEMPVAIVFPTLSSGRVSAGPR